MASIQAPDTLITQTLTVSNIGTADLDWSISETITFVGQAGPAVVSTGGGLTYYTDRPTFDAANPNLPIEDFENGIPGPGSVVGCPAPFNETTDNDCFAPGSILPGISFQDDPLNDAGGGSVNGMVFLGSGFAGNPTDVIIANTFVDSFDIFFTEVANAAGMDLVSYFNGDPITITVYAADGTTVLDTMTAPSSNAGIFWGVSANEPIGRIKLDSTTGQEAEGVDNIAFGTSSVCVDDDIPWVSASPNTGSTAPGDSDDVNIVFDSTGLSTGVYTGTLCIASNDLSNLAVTVPLTLTVITPTYAIDIAPDTTATGLPGTTVTHTMWVTNNSNVAGVVSLDVTGNSWSTAFSDNNFILDIGETAQIYAWADIPAGPSTSMDVATITASIGNASDSANATTTAESVYFYLPLFVNP
jgi:hypothetical protein